MIEICDCEALPIIPLSGECSACPARFRYRKPPFAEELMVTDESVRRERIAIENDRKWGMQASGQVGLPTCGDSIAGDGVFPVCA
jgi:hypothetical protein